MIDALDIYNRLIWLFVLIITVFLLLLCFLFLAMRAAQERESQSNDFSHKVIEGLETERRRISRELHDSVLPQVKDSHLYNLIRVICMDLMPPDFKQFPLIAFLEELCDKFSKKTGIECVCSIEEGIEFSKFDANNQLHLYRMVQEIFTNIEKHSGANKTSLVIRKIIHGSYENILICISDDGRGMNYPLPKTSLGIRSLQQRAVIIGAKIEFISESGNGLMVRIEIPIPLNLQALCIS